MTCIALGRLECPSEKNFWPNCKVDEEEVNSHGVDCLLHQLLLPSLPDGNQLILHLTCHSVLLLS